MLEELTEPILGEFNSKLCSPSPWLFLISVVFSQVLPRWAPELNRLQSLELWDGRTLGDENIRNLLRTHCPHLNKISIFQWWGDPT